MKIIKYILGVLFLLLAAGAAILFIRFFPCYKGAKFLQENVDLQKMSFDVTLTLLEENLSEQQKMLMEALTKITGIPKENLLVLHLQGNSQGDVIFVQITPQGAEKPVVELYLTDDTDLLNGAMLYETVRNNLINQFSMAELLLPRWNDGDYLSLEQTEQMFGLDLSGVKGFDIAASKEMLSFKKYFALLAIAEYEKEQGGNVVFSLEKASADGNTASMRLNLQEDMDPPVVLISGQVEDVQLTLRRLDEGLLEIGAETSLPEKKGLQLIKSIEGDITIGRIQEVELPDSLIGQDTVDKITALRTLMQDLLGK